MYAEYYDSELFDRELAITFERKERREYKAYVTGFPVLKWNSAAQQWQVEVRAEVPRQRKQKARSRKATRPGIHVHQRVLRGTSH